MEVERFSKHEQNQNQSNKKSTTQMNLCRKKEKKSENSPKYFLGALALLGLEENFLNSISGVPAEMVI